MSEKPLSTQPEPLHVLIVGGGLGGLAAAISVSLSGHRSTVFEGVNELREVGAGLQITPNGVRLLKAWGLAPLLEGKVTIPKVFSMYRYDGRILAHRENYGDEIESRYGSSIWCLHRADLQKAMVDRACELGVEVKLGVRVEDIDQKAPAVVLAGGHAIQGDAIIAADGLWSTTREVIPGTSSRPEPTGDLAYRILLDVKDIKDERLKDWLKKTGIHIWVGPDVHAVAYSIRDGSLLNLVLCVPDDLPTNVTKANGNLEQMKNLFIGWDSVSVRPCAESFVPGGAIY